MRQESTSALPSADPTWRIALIRSSFYKEEMDALTQSARDALQAAGIPEKNITEYVVPGSFEVPLIGAEIAASKKADALIGLGIIVEGDTHHARLLADQAARGIMNVQLQYRLPFAFEILYVDSLVDAQVRLDKGKEAAVAVMQSLRVLQIVKN